MARNEILKALPAVLLPAILLLCALLTAGCRTEPEQIEKPPRARDSALMKSAEQLVERGAPEHLAEAVDLLQGRAGSLPGAEELGAFALALFDLLYPELAETDYLRGGYFHAYNGPYRGTLDRAATGRPPAAGPAAGGEEFYDLVVPALFLARLDIDEEAVVQPTDLSGYLGLLEQAGRQNPSSVLPPYLLGRIYELQGNPDRAAALYRDSVDKASSFYPGAQRLALLLLGKGQAAEAAKLLEGVADLLPGERSILYPLARAYYETGRLEAASTALARILTEEPDRSDALLLRSRVLAAQGNWNQALRLLNLLLYQHPDNREAYLLAARLRYEKAADPEGALELLKEAESQFPDAPEFPELAGRIYLDTGGNEEGLAKLQRALELEPGRVTTLRLLLSNAMDERRWLRAEVYLSDILEQQQSEQDLLRAIEVYRNLGDTVRALHYSEQLYRGNPTVDNLVVYAQTLQFAEQPDKAAALVQQGLEQAETPAQHSALLTVRSSIIEEEAPQESMALLREALMEHPQNRLALIEIAELYVEQGELRKASLYLKQAIALDPNDTELQARLQSVEEALDRRNNP